MIQKYLNREEASAYLKERGLVTAKTTLQKMATVGGGPDFRKFGHRAVYLSDDLDNWAAQKLSAPRRSSSV